MSAFDLDGLCRDIMAMNEANAAMYRRMEMPRNPRPLPIAAYCKPMGRNMRPDTEELPMRDDIARCAELAALDEIVPANIRQMVGPINQTNEE